jgi:hypothetical protein
MTMKALCRIVFLAAVLTMMKSCSSPDADRVSRHDEALFTLILPEVSGVDFVNRVDDGEDMNILTYRNFYNGGGVAIGDINNDHLPDVFFTSNIQKNRLFLNRGNLVFEDISDSAGIGGSRAWSTGVTMADVNGDGLLDIYVCNSGDAKGDDRQNELFINNGDLTFTERAKEYNLNDEGFSTHASFFDYDLDGDLDCYVLNNSFKDPSRIELFSAKRTEVDSLGGDKLFRNDGGTFTNVTLRAGLYSSQIGFGLGVSVSDLNNDGWPDIYISNDFWERDYLYINKHDGTFTECLPERLSICSVSSMGADLADINNDGWIDIYTTDMLAADNYRLKTMTAFDAFYLGNMKEAATYHHQILQNCLHINRGENMSFQEQANITGTAATDWSWGALMFDFENDGDKDIYVCNGIARDIMYLDFTEFISDNDNVKHIVKEKGRFDWRDFVPYIPSNPISNYAFRNDGLLKFSSQAESLGLATPSFSNGAAYGDLDNDGDLDLIVNNVNMPAFVFRNNTNNQTQNSFLKMRFEGHPSNAFGVGVRVNIYSGKIHQMYENYPARGFQSATSSDLTIGLGLEKIDSVNVLWPTGESQHFYNVRPGSTLTVRVSEASKETQMPGAPKKTPQLLQYTNGLFPGDIRHKENEYYDFSVEPLLHRMLSTEGPRLLSGDINGDNLTDILQLGAKGYPDRILTQTAKGTFIALHVPELEADSLFESTCGVMVDLNNDDMLDLVIGSGGNESPVVMDAYRLRLYWNTGAGGFRKDRSSMLQKVVGNFSVVAAADFNSDGYTDLYLGSRVLPGNYGIIPRSYLLGNMEGMLVDISTAVTGNLGMVTDAVWSDYDKDNDPDLLVVGDWMPITVVINDKGSLKGRMEMPGTRGWWNRIHASDVDHDGDDDYIIGNWGLNTKMTASVERPLRMNVKDFDGNDKSEFVISWYPPLDTVAYPFHPKLELMQQLPYLKKNNLKYEAYSHMTYETLFKEETRKNALQYTTEKLESVIIWNDKGKPEIVNLPREAQIFPVFGICADDFDSDGITDLLLAGNFYALKPQMGRCDSGRGVLLLGNADRSFTATTANVSGVDIPGEVRDLLALDSKTGKHILVARNNNTLLALKVKAAK